ncbi:MULTISPECIES: EcsC family protein [Phenylobacterium]|uniref:EcsC family protein n=1 Tax=Phenylobacterium koreense TaxID=266125 RepID=A0ABV2EIB1_9CAUL
MPDKPPFAAPEAEYEAWAAAEVARWRRQMLKAPNLIDKAARGTQQRVNAIIPEKAHAAVTAVVEKMTRAILLGSNLTTAAPLEHAPLSIRDAKALGVISGYRTAAAVEGGVAGAGGFWLALADFPALIAIKIKLLFDLAAVYGHRGSDFSERLYLLHLFQLAFSSAARRAEVFRALEDWDARAHPQSLDEFDWRKFQQEYRDYIDLAKMAQLIPLIGAPVGAVVNWRLTERLGSMAMNGYRGRWLTAL